MAPENPGGWWRSATRFILAGVYYFLLAILVLTLPGTVSAMKSYLADRQNLQQVADFLPVTTLEIVLGSALPSLAVLFLLIVMRLAGVRMKWRKGHA